MKACSAKRLILSLAVLVCSASRIMGQAPAAPLDAKQIDATQKVPAGLDLTADKLKENSSGDLENLEEVKKEGARRSAYLTEHRQAVDGQPPQPRLDVFRKEIGPVLQEYCTDCHGTDTQERNFRIDTLNPDLVHGDDASWWLEVVDVLSNGEMPPEDAAALPDADRSRIVEWLSREIQVASQVRRNDQKHSSFRRMTNYETNYTLQDLLGLPYDFAQDLPPETASEDGFENSSEMLQISASQLDTYRSLARTALTKATVRGERPETIYYGITMDAAADKMRELENNPDRRKFRPKDAHFIDLATGSGVRAAWKYGGAKYRWEPSKQRPKNPALSSHVAIIPSKQQIIFDLGDKLPDEGYARVRVRASRASMENEILPSLQLFFGQQASNDSHAKERVRELDLVIDASPDAPQFYEWDIPLSEVMRNPFRKVNKVGDLPNPAEYIMLRNSSLLPTNVQIDFVEVIAPFYTQWPPESHSRIFVECDTSDEVAYVRDVLENFMFRAWRRPVTAVEVDQKLALFTQLRPVCDSFEDTVIEVLATVLASPKFLYLANPPAIPDAKSQDLDAPVAERIGEYELATRLSMFLWCSAPDAQLLELAKRGQLNTTENLLSETERLLNDPRSERFVKHFVRGWLGMQLLDYLDVDKKAYPQFDSSLKEAMQQEPLHTFEAMLKHNHSVIDFIHADYTMVNARLAEHYRLSNVELSDLPGNAFHRVSLATDDRRGGLLTAAGLLAMNSDGKDSHPLKRGIWMLESLLNDPPPPPPPAVPEIDLADPEIAKLTLKQRIEDHRNNAACMSCHAKIDPWGIALENFDAVGDWRDEIRDTPVDATSHLFNGQQLDGVDGLKRFLLTFRQDQFARAMVHKLTTFALGRPLTFNDRHSVDELTAQLRRDGDGLRTLVKLVVTSELFQSR